jgi:hypothetical protein
MKQFQVAVEHAGHRIFVTEWVTGVDAAIPLAMLLASKFPPPYEVLVALREQHLVSIRWDEFVTGGHRPE